MSPVQGVPMYQSKLTPAPSRAGIGLITLMLVFIIKLYNFWSY